MSKAMSDIRTGKITGCEEGTFAWYHEVGHLEFDKTEWGAKRRFYQEQTLVATILFCTFSFFVIYFKFFALLFSILYIYFFLEEEIICNKYAKRNVKCFN